MRTLPCYRSFSRCLVLTAVMSILCEFLPGEAVAALVTGPSIVEDNFTADDGVTGNDLNGRTPADANLPGGTWYSNKSWSGGLRQTHMGFETGMIQTDESARISIASAGLYTKPTNLEIYARFKVTATGTDTDKRGALIGFSSVGTGGGTTAPWGIAVRGSDGRLSLIENSDVAAQQYAFAGTWDNNIFHEMNYWVDTTTGSISNFTLDGVSYNFTSAAFTDAVTTFGIFTASSQTGGSFPTYMDTFRISELVTPPPAPEPNSGLLLLGLLGLAARRRQRSI